MSHPRRPNYKHRVRESEQILALMPCYHEAAHFVVARHFGLRPWATLTPPPGAPQSWGAMNAHAPGTHEENAVVSLAGDLVDDMFLDRLFQLATHTITRDGVGADGVTDDLRHFFAHVALAVDGDKARGIPLAERLEDETRALLMEKWPEVAQVAHLLAERGELRDEEAAR